MLATLAVACNDNETADAGESTANTWPNNSLPTPDDSTLAPDKLPLVDDVPGAPTTQAPSADATTSTTNGRGTTTTQRSAGGGGNTTRPPVTGSPNTTRRPATTQRPAPTTAPTTGAPATTGVTQPPPTPSTTLPATTAAVPTTAAPTTAAPTTAPPTTAPPIPPASASLLAGRMTFGVSAEIESELLRLGTGAWVEQQLGWDRPDPATESLLGDFRFLGASRQQAYQIVREDNDPFDEELTHSNVVRARYSRYQLFENMVHLWMDHLNVNLRDNGGYRHLMFDYQERVIRGNAMGRYADLLLASAQSPAMMVYLDNYRSNANSSSGVNENYGRELLELHSLGINRDGTQDYTEADVRGASLIMSGWGVFTDRNAGNYSDFRYRPDYHHNETVSILGGAFTSGGGGEADGVALVNFLARHPTTARHICWKIARRFVSDNPSTTLVNALASVYLANDTAIVPVLRALFESDEFASSAGLKMNRPFELVMAAMRGLGSSVPTDPNTDAARTIRFRLGDLNHDVWRWDQPDGYPDFATPWLSSNGLLDRWGFTARLANDFHTNPNEPDPILTDVNSLRSGAATAGEIYDRIVGRLNVVGIAPAIKDTLLDLVGVTAATPAADVEDDSVREIASFLLAHPLFQLR